jgi:hypothetical protein
MVVEGQWVMSEAEISRQQGAALLEYRKAKQALEHLLTTADSMSKQARHVAKLLEDLRRSNDYIHGPGTELLQLPKMEYGETYNLAAITAFANSVILALKRVEEATQHTRELGVAE